MLSGSVHTDTLYTLVTWYEWRAVLAQLLSHASQLLFASGDLGQLQQKLLNTLWVRPKMVKQAFHLVLQRQRCCIPLQGQLSGD